MPSPCAAAPSIDQRSAVASSSPSPTELPSATTCTPSKEQSRESSDTFYLACSAPTTLPTSPLEVAEWTDPRELREDELTRSYQQVQWSSEGAHLEEDTFDELLAPPPVQLLPWDGSGKGRLVRVTSDLMDERFTCPECFDDRKVEWGSNEFSVVSGSLFRFQGPS